VGSAIKWIKEFLTNRKQAVVVEGRKSSLQKVLSGVLSLYELRSHVKIRPDAKT
jgi:hypothetical protein